MIDTLAILTHNFANTPAEGGPVDTIEIDDLDITVEDAE